VSHIHFVGGEKGGVGKSLFAQLLCQWFLERPVSLAALDADPSNGVLLRGYADCCRAVDLSVFESADLIMDVALSRERKVVVDLAAQSFRQLARWLRQSDVVAFAHNMNVDLSYWHVTDGGFDSMKSLEMALPELAPSVHIIIVCNGRWSDDFSHLEATGPFQEVRKRGGAIIQLPALDPRIVFKSEAGGASLRAVFDENQRKQGSLTAMEQRRVAHFRVLVSEQLEPIPLAPAALEVEAQAEPSLAESTPAEFVVTGAEPPQTDEAAVSETETETDSTEEGDDSGPTTSRSVLPPSPPQLAVGTKWIDGARTWSEVSPTGIVHHVRYK
jgi:hypothetical protein